MMLISEKRASRVCARAMKRAAAAMPPWSGAPLASGRRSAGILPARVEDGTRRQDACGTGDAKWRRISGMTSAIETFMDLRERKAAISRVVRWLKKKTRVSERAGVSTPLPASAAALVDPLPQGERETAGADPGDGRRISISYFVSAPA